MKRIYKNSDIQIKLKSIRGLSDNFIIKFFTTNKEFFIRKTNEDVYTIGEEKYIKLNWSELETIGDGVLNYVFNTIKDDSDYDDGEFNNTISRTTDYYICSNFKVDPETDKSISEVIAELSDEFDTEKTRSTNKDTEHDTAISELNDDLEIEADARGAADLTLQANIDSEATTRQNADTTLQTNIDTKANIGDSYTKAQSDAKYLTEHQDISNLATKTELGNETTARQAKETQLQSSIDGKADIEDVYNKQTINSIFATKEELKKINCGEY